MTIRRPTAIAVYVGVICALALLALNQASWVVPQDSSVFWNCLAVFLVLAVVSESAFLQLPIGTSTSSVGFIPHLAAVVLLGPSWAMGLAGVNLLLVESVLRRKALIKVIHNTSKEILAVGSAGLVFTALGGTVSISAFEPQILPFAAAVTVYMILNAGAPALAIAISSGTRVVDSWKRLVGGSFLFDFLASPLALLLAFLYTRADLWGVIVVTVPLFLIRHVYSVNLQIEQVNRDLLELMVKAIEARDPYTSGHSQRVSRIAGVMGRELGLSGKQLDQIETAALLHDVGKIHEEYAAVLRKPGLLTPEEIALMRTHPIRSYELVRTISGFRGGVDQAVRHHHENFDGSGYPDGLAGELIPIAARIILVADTADAMTTDRPYRSALSYEQLVAELDRYAGSQFDPELVKLFKASSSIRFLITADGVPEGSRRPVPKKLVHLA